MLHYCTGAALLQSGEHFSAGLDLAETSNFDAIGKATPDVARRAFRFRKLALAMQVRLLRTEPIRLARSTTTTWVGMEKRWDVCCAETSSQEQEFIGLLKGQL